MLEHCADPEKDYLDFKPGTSPTEIEALRKDRDEWKAQAIGRAGYSKKECDRANAAEARVRELEAALEEAVRELKQWHEYRRSDGNYCPESHALHIAGAALAKKEVQP
jgi:hypothetical protein